MELQNIWIGLERTMEQNGVEQIDFPAEDYLPLKDYGAWRVAVLKYCANTRLENIDWMQKHLETDEVFVLLQGNCTLLIAGKDEIPGNVRTIEMEPHRIYSIKKGHWHNHVLDEEGEVLIVENRDTSDDNSPVYHMNGEEIMRMRSAVNHL